MQSLSSHPGSNPLYVAASLLAVLGFTLRVVGDEDRSEASTAMLLLAASALVVVVYHSTN